MGATFVPSWLWGTKFPLRLAPCDLISGERSPVDASSFDTAFYLHPRYRSGRTIDSTLRNIETGLDEFISEKYADQIAAILAGWSASLLKSPQETQAFTSVLAVDFSGTSLLPATARVIRSGTGIEVRENTFASQTTLNLDAFVRDLESSLQVFSSILTAEFQVIGIEVDSDAKTDVSINSSHLPDRVNTRVRYEIVGTGSGFHREQRVGTWHLTWEPAPSGDFRIRSWRVLDETQSRSQSAVYADVTAEALGRNASYSAQLAHGTDYWRTVVDGACGIDIYGHNGVSVADIDNDGFDDLYICQPAGLPNRLFRNRGDGTFEDVTEESGLGVLENTACALFADFDNDGRQDVIVVCANGPLLFLNQGDGRFREKRDAFRFANPPQGTFTGAAVADYDRDGWLDIYFCLYAYYQGTGQYKYPSPYYDAENGLPNFLMRNQRDGTFRDVTAESGLNQNNTRYSFCCGWGDCNRDGWPDLYVVNDFGRKNLYRNNGDGTFADVAAAAGVEDVGAGMSVSWLDYDNDGSEDLYVGNMWTAAGERISTQEVFKKESNKDIRALYQKHAMGNSLFRNRIRNGSLEFENVTNSCGARVGRWSWSSDAFDFDHDGFPDFYLTNGMVSGPSRQDVNSFFWRQVVARSPDEARGSREYEQGWNAINELIRSDGTWSGYERNVFYANNRNGRFSDVSGVVGLDFIEDGRSFALADFDHDGRLEIVLKNRNAPQVRVLKSIVSDLPPSLSFRLQGTKSNRDAIGAAVTITTEHGSQTRMLQAGSGFLSQHSKDLFFGLGDTYGTVQASIRWPSGLVQELRDLPVNHRVWVKEGSQPSRAEPFKPRNDEHGSIVQTLLPQSQSRDELFPASVETWLLEPISAPDFSLPDLSGRSHTLSAIRGKPVFLNFWSAESKECQPVLRMLQKARASWETLGLQSLTINMDTAAPDLKQSGTSQVGTLRAFIRDQQLSLSILLATADVAAIYNILYRQLFDRHRDLSLPASLLIDARGDVVKVYQGTIDAKQIEEDARNIPRTDAERLARALPFPNAKFSLEVSRNYLSLGSLYFQHGYLDQAESSFQQALRDDPSSAEALYGIGSVYINQNKNAAAREIFERVVKLQANYPDTLPDAWNNLGVIATREGRSADSVGCFQQALRLNPHHQLALDNLGNAYRLLKRWEDARTTYERALEISHEDAEANYGLGMVFAQSDDTAHAYEYLQRALQSRPVYPEALNNLGVLYLRMDRRAEAVASFERCIRAAPTFDQAYLNLARVYALEGSRDKARGVLVELLKEIPDDPQAKQMLEQLGR